MLKSNLKTQTVGLGECLNYNIHQKKGKWTQGQLDNCWFQKEHENIHHKMKAHFNICHGQW